MYNIYFNLNIGLCHYPVAADRVQEVLDCLNKLNIEVERIDMTN